MRGAREMKCKREGSIDTEGVEGAGPPQRELGAVMPAHAQLPHTREVSRPKTLVRAQSLATRICVGRVRLRARNGCSDRVADCCLMCVTV